MAFGISGDIGNDFAAQLQQQLAQQLAQRIALQQVQQAQQRIDLDAKRFNEQVRSNAFNESRVKRADQVEEANATAGALDAGFDPASPLDVEVPEDAAAKLQGTPQGARVREIATIEARPTVPGMSEMGPQGVGVRRLTPTSEQQGDRRIVEVRRRTSGQLAGAKTEAERRAAAALAFEQGLNVPDSLMRPTLEEVTAAEAAERDRAMADEKELASYREGLIRTRPTPPPRGGLADMTPAETQAVFRLQDDYSRDSKPYLTMRDAYQRVSSAREDAAGDLSLIFAYMKMLDPNSVVRETEFANAQNAAGVPDQIRNIYNRAREGVRLNPNQRAQFKGQARLLFTDAHNNQTKVRQTYQRRAQQFGIDPAYVLDAEDASPQAEGGGFDPTKPYEQVR